MNKIIHNIMIHNNNIQYNANNNHNQI